MVNQWRVKTPLRWGVTLNIVRAEGAVAGPRARLDGLDALRGIAAAMVVLFHVQHLFHRDFGLHRAFLAVDLFFVLSGYVLARTYERKLENGLPAREFLVGRLRRLWPSMALGAVLGIAAFWPDFSPFARLLVFATSVTMVPLVSPIGVVFPTNPPAWSIVFELFANWLHSVLLRRLNVRTLVVIAAVAIVGLASSVTSLNVGYQMEGFWLGIPRVVASYAMGVVIWRIVGDREMLPGWLSLILLPVAILLLGLAPKEQVWPDFLFVAVIAPLAVISGIAPLHARWRSGFSLLGGISFTLYALHYPILVLVRRTDLPLASWVIVLIAAGTVAWTIRGPHLRQRRTAFVPL